ncbi:MAG: L-rhamnose mutarotase [Candidatus Poribacteria bacterium]|nr:L-rhamnose mutarotase [Candidatus Poribacteria bacterium]
MYSIGLAMKLRPGCYEEYKVAHDNLWPEIGKGMEDNNVSMAIYRFEDHLVLHAVAPSEQDWLKSREGPELVRWHDYMATLLETDDAGNIVFEELPEAFAFGMFKSE